jgi:HEAT repeat protein
MPDAAAPLLARDLAYRESVYAKWLPWLATRLPIGLVQYLPQPANAMMIRTRAANVLSQMGTNAAPALPQLLRVATHSDRNAQIRALELIAQLGDLARSAAPQLQTLLAGANPEVRTAAAAALAKIPSAASSSIPALLKAWRSGRLPVLQTLAALTQLAYSAPETIPDLISILESGTFKKITNGSATNAAGSPVEVIDSPRTKACEYLGGFGSAASPAVPALSHMLVHSDSRVRAKAAWALGQMGPAAAPSAPALATAVGDYWWYVRENAARALGEIGPAAAQEAAAALESVRGDANADVRAAVSKSLQRITSAAPASVP